MARPTTYNTFKETGWKAACETVVYTSGNGVAIAQPGAGKHILLLGIIASDSVTLRKDTTGIETSGTVILSLENDGDDIHRVFDFPGAIDLGANVGLYMDFSSQSPTDHVNIFYHIVDAALE
jgi:hypothetical protein